MSDETPESIATQIIKDSQPNLTNGDIPENCIVYLHKCIAEAIRKERVVRVPSLQDTVEYVKVKYYASVDSNGNFILRNGFQDFIDGANFIQMQVTKKDWFGSELTKITSLDEIKKLNEGKTFVEGVDDEQ